jgi:hypothetical protein
VRNLIHQVALTLALASSFAAAPAPARDAASNGAIVNQAATFQATGISCINAPTQTPSAGGVNVAYRELGKQNGGTPIVFRNHLTPTPFNFPA